MNSNTSTPSVLFASREILSQSRMVNWWAGLSFMASAALGFFGVATAFFDKAWPLAVITMVLSVITLLVVSVLLRTTDVLAAKNRQLEAAVNMQASFEGDEG